MKIAEIAVAIAAVLLAAAMAAKSAAIVSRLLPAGRSAASPHRSAATTPMRPPTTARKLPTRRIATLSGTMLARNGLGVDARRAQILHDGPRIEVQTVTRAPLVTRCNTSASGGASPKGAARPVAPC